MIAQVTIESFNVDELLCLRDEIDAFLRKADASEYAYFESSEDWEDLNNEAIQAATKLRNRIKGLAIDLEIQGDFLREFIELNKKWSA